MYLTCVPPFSSGLAAGHRPDHEERLEPRRDRGRQRRVGQLVGQILLAGEEANKRPAAACDVVADRPAQHRIASLERVEDGTLRDGGCHLEHHLTVDARQLAQVCREHHPDHPSVWTSTDSTAGRSWTLAAQPSPASADAYPCPPVVPKYTPHESSESIAIASRSTLT